MNMDFSHLDSEGRARMVDVSGKPVVRRVAEAGGSILVGSKVITALRERSLKKGDPLSAARIAGIMAAKKTGELIPLCHPLPLDHISLEFQVKEDRIDITARAVTSARTGVEMEALTAVSVAALTIYDMCKAVSHDMTIENIRLISKRKQQDR
ncbi:MAG: cyclic pyranopterin monophosphate synthase MoaC [Candidatus Latescibacteria bacterium]|nr:cyclic pyranopterin monophosphate synthase MoaC [bacterium]MBD3425084.1 cyclic pyranopterin monophosphate synthase MoaC [Candidatus Latescibacterota bacterium]